MKPGDFLLGSHQSRAAARALLANRHAAFERREVIIGCPVDGSAPHVTPWHINVKKQIAGRVVSIPEGMTVAEGLRALGGYSEKELAIAAEHRSEPLNIGTMLMLRR